MNDRRPVDVARELAARASAQADRAERGRRLPRDLSDALADAGLYRLCVPAVVGGGEAPPPG